MGKHANHVGGWLALLLPVLRTKEPKKSVKEKDKR